MQNKTVSFSLIAIAAALLMVVATPQSGQARPGCQSGCRKTFTNVVVVTQPASKPFFSMVQSWWSNMTHLLDTR